MDKMESMGVPPDKEIVYQILKHVPAAIYHIDLVNQRILMVNEYMCQEMGYTEAEFLSLNLAASLAPESRILFQQRLQAMAAGESVSDNVELQFVRKNGEIEWGRLHIHHIAEEGRVTSAYVVAHIITEEKRLQEELAKNRQDLERLVEARTRELSLTNRLLRKEIEQRKAATEKLRAYSKRLEEMNTAMRVLLDKRNEEHKRSEEHIRMHLKELIEPYLERLENSELRNFQQQLIDVIRANVDDVMGSTNPLGSSKFFVFSPNELQVVNLIRTGKTNKEMSRLLNVSIRTIETYRSSIRKKLNIKNKKVNLRTYLSSL